MWYKPCIKKITNLTNGIIHILVPIWFTGQLLAPLLDKLDSDWSLETSGFWVVAKKK